MKSFRTTVAGIAVMAAVGFAPTATTPAAADSPSILQWYQATPGVGYEHAMTTADGDLIEWAGTSCDTYREHVRLVSDSPDGDRSFMSSSSGTCAPSAGPLSVQGVTSGLAPEAVASSGSNFIHTSRTYQDIVNVDLGWQRTSYNRFWDYANYASWWDESLGGENLVSMSAVSGDFAYWNSLPPTLKSWGIWGCRNNCNALGQANTEFRVGAICRWDVTTSVSSYTEGTYGVDWFTNGGCGGIHVATGTKSNTSRTGGYGGSGNTICAIPNSTVNYQTAGRWCTPTRLP